jgi:hypothetical protein
MSLSAKFAQLKGARAVPAGNQGRVQQTIVVQQGKKNTQTANFRGAPAPAPAQKGGRNRKGGRGQAPAQQVAKGGRGGNAPGKGTTGSLSSGSPPGFAFNPCHLYHLHPLHHHHLLYRKEAREEG